jgi:hypothetical protein
MKKEFSTSDIKKALGIPRERLKDWMNNGYIKATIPAKGRGTKAIFTKVDMYFVELFSDLIKKGFKRDRAAHFIQIFSEILRTEYKGPEEPAGRLAWIFFLYVREHRQAISASLAFEISRGKLPIESYKDIFISPQNWDHVHAVNFATLRDRVDRALAELD